MNRMMAVSLDSWGPFLSQNVRGKRFGVLVGAHAMPARAGTHSKTFPAAVLSQKVALTSPDETSIIIFILLIILFAFHP